MIRRWPQILVVDDNEDLRSTYQLGLESVGYPVAVAQDGADALKMLSAVHPDIVLLDINMPEMDGIEFLERLSAGQGWRPRTVIAMSADPHYSPLARKLGAFEFVEKPITLEYLLPLVERAAIGRPVSPELKTIHLRERDQLFSADDLRRKAILATFPPADRILHRMIANLLSWLSGYFDVLMTLMNLLRGDELEIFANHGVPDLVPYGTLFPCDDTYCAALIRTEETMILKDALLHPLYKSHTVTTLGIRFYVSVPIRVEKGLAVGTLCLESFRPAEFYTEDLRLLHFFSDALGAAIRGAAAPPPRTWSLFPDPIFLSNPAFVTALKSRIARARRVPIGDLVGFCVSPLGRELQESLSLAFERGPKGGVALGKGAFGICGLGPRAALEQLIGATQARWPRFAPSLFPVGEEIPTELLPLLSAEWVSPTSQAATPEPGQGPHSTTT